MKDNNTREERTQKLQDAIDYIEENMIEQVGKLRQNKKKKASINWKKAVTQVASIALVLVGAYACITFVGPNFYGDKSNGGQESAGNSDATPGYVDENDTTKDGADENDTPQNNMGQSGGEGAPEQEGVPESDVLNSEEWNPNFDAETNGDNETMGDVMNIGYDWVKVFMLPNKIWEEYDEQEAMEQVVVIAEEYRDDIQKFLGNMYVSPVYDSKQLPAFDTDMRYHLFFEKKDGAIVHCVLDEGYVHYDAMPQYYIELEESAYEMMVNILAQHW